jgi:hypothetical protein
MAAVLLALAYPIFIRISDTLGKLAIGLKESVRLNNVPDDFVDRLHKFVELLTTEVSAIGVSSTKIMSKLPNMTKDLLDKQNEKLSLQIKFANNSTAWAMKSVGPLLLYYFIQCESSSS